MMRRKVVFMGIHHPPNWLRNLRNQFVESLVIVQWMIQFFSPQDMSLEIQ